MFDIKIYPVISEDAYVILLNKCNRREWRNKYGYKFVHYIVLDNECIGLIVYDVINMIGSVSIQVDMLDIDVKYRGNGIGSFVLYKLMRDYNSSVIYGQVDIASIAFLEHIGAVVKVRKSGQELNDGSIIVPYTLAYKRISRYINKKAVMRKV